MQKLAGKYALLSAALAVLVLAALSNHTAAETGCIPPPPQMIAWWPADGDRAEVISGLSSTTGGGLSFAAGMVDQAFILDGIDDYLSVPEPVAGPALDNFTALTIDAWIYPDPDQWHNPEGGGTLSAIVSKYNSRLSNGISYYLDMKNSLLRLAVFESRARFAVFQSDKPLPADTWSHVAGVWRGGSAFELYLNGLPLSGSLNFSGGPPSAMADNDVPLNIGRYESFSSSWPHPAGYFHGLIDEIEIFNRALAPEEIAAIYHAGAAGKCKSRIITVTIDIKPGSDPNSINPRSNGVIPVAVLTTADFDALTVDPLSVLFGPDGAVERHGRGHFHDVDADGDLDLVFHFKARDAGLQCGDTAAGLIGSTYAGQKITGIDTIHLVGCKWHPGRVVGGPSVRP